MSRGRILGDFSDTLTPLETLGIHRISRVRSIHRGFIVFSIRLVTKTPIPKIEYRIKQVFKTDTYFQRVFLQPLLSAYEDSEEIPCRLMLRGDRFESGVVENLSTPDARVLTYSEARDFFLFLNQNPK